MSSVQHLVKRLQSGDADAFTELVDVLQDPVASFVRRNLGRHLSGRVDPEDIIQTAFAKALQLIPNLEWRGEKEFVAWIRAIARNEILRVVARHRTEHSFYLSERRESPQSEAVTPSRVMRRHERLERLQRALDDLPSDYRQVVWLARVDGWRIREIAEYLGRSETATQKLLLRGLDRLRDQFGDTRSLGLPARPLRRVGGDGVDRETT